MIYMCTCYSTVTVILVLPLFLQHINGCYMYLQYHVHKMVLMSFLSLRMKKIPYLRPMKPRESFNTSTTNIVRICESKSRVSLLVMLLFLNLDERDWICWSKNSIFRSFCVSDVHVYGCLTLNLISYLSILFLLNIWERNLLTSTKNTLSSNVCWFQDIFVFAELEDIQIEILKVLLTHSDPVDVSG